MGTFIIAAIVFALAMLAISISTITGRGRHECSCKKAARVMRQVEASSCKGCDEAEGATLVELRPKSKT